VTIEVPAGTQNGQRFRLRKRGVPRPDDGTRGDLWVEARVVIPAVTDDRARSLLKQLGAALAAEPDSARGSQHGSMPGVRPGAVPGAVPGKRR
jgi:DnaJ-class molecular chaperone